MARINLEIIYSTLILHFFLYYRNPVCTQFDQIVTDIVIFLTGRKLSQLIPGTSRYAASRGYRQYNLYSNSKLNKQCDHTVINLSGNLRNLQIPILKR
jgi:hypothetical protein